MADDKNNNFDFNTLREQIEQIKKSLEAQRNRSQQVDEDVDTDDRWAEQKEAFGKMLDAYDAFLPQADVANLFGLAAERLENAAEALKQFQKAAKPSSEEAADETTEAEDKEE